MARLISRTATLLGLVGGICCAAASSIAPKATVYFTMDAPLCSSHFAVRFSIDGALVGTETLTVGIAGRERATSRGYQTLPGEHVLGAQLINGATVSSPGFVWPDRTLTLLAGQVFTDSLSAYCS